MLQELAELGMQLARLAVQQALQEQATEPKPRRADPRVIFLRLSTAIRETIVLKTRLAAGLLPPHPGRPANPTATHPICQTCPLNACGRRVGCSWATHQDARRAPLTDG
jgi:hypothetical protein